MKKTTTVFAVLAFAGFMALPVHAAETSPAVQPKPAASSAQSTAQTTAQPSPATSASQPAVQTPRASTINQGTGGSAPAVPAKPILPVTATPANTANQAPTVPAKSEPAVKIGFVDMVKIANESVPGKAAYADIKARTTKVKSRVEAKKKQLEKEKTEIEASIQSLTPQQRNAKAKGFQKKLEDFQKFVEKAQKELEARESELLGKLYKSIEKSANDYGKANGLAVIVSRKELLYIGENVNVKDITDEITKAVNTEQQKSK